MIVGLVAVALLLLGATAGVLLDQPETRPEIPGTASVDVGFAQDMSVHHENAVQMASWTRDHTRDPAVRQLAYDIESGQTAQIGRMQGWLTLWDAPSQATNGYMRWMMPATTGAGMDHPGDKGPDRMAQMPGMASPEDLARLRASTGPAADVLFLQLMLRHHDGGAAMLRYAAQRAELPQTRTFALQMLTAQTAESQLMRQMLADRAAAPLPP